MAEISSPQLLSGKKRGMPRMKKSSLRVDLTPMVDLGFLLITFFMVTISWSQPRILKFFLPAEGTRLPVPSSASLTIIPVKADQIFYYAGLLQDAIKSGQMGMSNYYPEGGIRDLIRQKQLLLDRNSHFINGRRELMVMIKPAHSADFRHIMALFDEMLINNVTKYALLDLNEGEIEFLTERKLFDSSF